MTGSITTMDTATTALTQPASSKHTAKHTADQGKLAQRFALFSLLALMCYQMCLCFLNTHGMNVTDSLVATVEVVILLLMAAWLAPQRPIADFAVPALISSLLLMMWLVRGEPDVYAPRDLTIMVVSYWLGQSVPSQKAVNRIVTIIFCVVFVFACMEYFFTTLYLEIFDILKYAIARGVVSEHVSSYLHTNLFVSGTRVKGRNLLPFLGDQRVSSIFFEPVSMGNFGVILAMWGLSYDRFHRRQMLVFCAMAVFVIIACDGRFASMTVVLLILMRMVPLTRTRTMLLLYPVGLLMGLVPFTFAKIFSGVSDDLPGRIMRTGELLVGLDVINIFGLGPVESFGDSGIPYTIEMFGIVLCAVLWIIFVMLKLQTNQAKRLKAMTALYCLSLLLISGKSFYSSKTAALLWFLLGSVSQGATLIARKRATTALAAVPA